MFKWFYKLLNIRINIIMLSGLILFGAMCMGVPCEEVKIERYIHIQRDGLLTLTLAGGKSVYLPLPAEIRHLIKELYSLDVSKRGDVIMRCDLIKEASGNDIADGVYEAKIVYTIKKNRGVKLNGRGVKL